MIYTFNLTLDLVDILSVVLALLLIGAMIGWKFLPPPIDDQKEKLIDDLFQENIKLKLGQFLPKK